jgi:protein-tyrosine-phosphatase
VSYSKSYDISSAGIHVDEPIAPPQDAIVSAKGFGIDLSDHRSRQINYSMMESYDMVISMEVWQYKYLRKLFLEFENKLYLFPLFDHSHTASMNAYYKYNIQDPYGRNSDDFKKCYLRIDTCITQLLSKIGMIPEILA